MRTLDIDPVVLVVALVTAGVLAFAGAHFALAAAAAAAVVVAFGGGSRGYAWLRLRLSMPPAGSAERGLVERALAARAAMRTICAAVPEGPVAGRCRQMAAQGRPAVTTIRLLALHAATVRRLHAAIGVAGLEEQRARALQRLGEAPPEAVSAELRSSLRAIESQLATAHRMDNLGAALAARTQALTASLEALAAGVAEVLALSQSDPSAIPAARLDQLASEVDALRHGLEAAQDLNRQAAVIQLMEA